MALEFRLPDIGEGLAEAEVIEWLVPVGAPVAMDQPLVQVETDKAVTDIPAPRAGVLLHQGALAGSVVKVGEVLAVIGDPGERWDDGGRRAEAPPIVGSLLEAEFVRSPAPRPESVAHARPSARAVVTGGALPLVRKLAKDLGVDLATVAGSGPGGRITREDVERAAAAGPDRSDRDRVRLSKLRRTIADRMARSWREIPHVTTFAEADAARLVEERARLARDVRPVPLEALFVLAVAPALGSHPEFNASVDGDDLLLSRRLDIGLAVDTPDGLMVAVVRDAGERDVLELADEMTRLTKAVRTRTATPEDLTGNTFTISNIGAVGGEFGTPIIPYGTTAILSFGRIRDRVVARADRPSIRPLLPLSLSYDHRVIDGASGRRFLSAVVDAIENPAVLFFR